MSQTTSPSALSPAQLQVVSALASGASISKAARICQVGRTTIYTWLNTVPDFVQTLHAATTDAARQLHDTLHDSSMDALNTVSAIMNDPKAPASVRLRAALAFLNRPTFPDKGWALPYPIGTPAQIEQQETANQMQAELNNMKTQQALRQFSVIAGHTAAAQRPAAAPPQNGTVRNNSEQKTQNSKPVHPMPSLDPQKLRNTIAAALRRSMNTAHPTANTNKEASAG